MLDVTAARHALEMAIDDLLQLVASEAAQTSAHEALDDRLVKDYQRILEKAIDAAEDAAVDRALDARDYEESERETECCHHD